MNASTSGTEPDPGSPDMSALAAVDNGPQLNATIWALTAVSTLFLGLRVYCKLWRQRRLRWDDWFLAAGWVSVALIQIHRLEVVYRL